MIFLLILVYSGLMLFEVPELIRNKYWRELSIFSLLLLFSFVLSLLQAKGIELPNITHGLIYLIRDILHLGY